MSPIPLNSGNALANSDGDFIMTLTKTPNLFWLPLLIQLKHLGIFAKNPIATNQSNYGR